MRMRVLRDPELSRILQVLVVLLLILCSGAFLFFRQTLQQVNQEYILRNLDLAGKLVETHPELEGELVELILQEPTVEGLARGREVLTRYGYDEELTWEFNHQFKSTYQTLSRSIWGLLLAFSIITIASAFGIVKFIYQRLDQLSLSIDRVMAGDFHAARLNLEGEGQLAMLSFHFNQMAERFRLTMQDLQEERQKLKDLISDISHQLKTPLASIRTFNDLLLEEEEERSEVEQVFLEKTSQQLDRMEWLIASLLKVSRLESGVTELEREREWGDLSCLVEGLAREYRPLMEERGLELVTSLPMQPVRYYFNVRWLGEGIGNLLENAMKYSTSGGRVELSLADRDSRVILQVTDQGMGIGAEELPYIFERFYRGTGLAGKNIPGTGIGLALTKLIVEKHGGFVRAESQIGQGTRFTVILPKERVNLTKS